MAFHNAEKMYNSYFDKKRVSITPHATYSVANNLVELINCHATKHSNLISFHNQETASENTFFKEGKGAMFDFLDIAAKTNHQFVATGQNALPSFLAKLHPQHKMLLVHNTFTNKEDIAWAKQYANNIYWCFCPNANKYIEDKQPNYSIFTEENCTIGTDSLASNWQLSILFIIFICLISFIGFSLQNINIKLPESTSSISFLDRFQILMDKNILLVIGVTCLTSMASLGLYSYVALIQPHSPNSLATSLLSWGLGGFIGSSIVGFFIAFYSLT